MIKNMFYFKKINSIGGIESWLYNISELYGDQYDINIFYKEADQKQLERLSRKAHCYQYGGQKIKCEKAILCYNTDIINDIEANEYCQFLHGDYKALNKLPMLSDKVTKYYAISEQVRKSFFEMTGIDSEVVYNPLFFEPKTDLLKLVSATRLTHEKGKERIEKLAKMLNKNGIPFKWDVYTNDRDAIKVKGVNFCDPVLDIYNHLADYDYLVQLSDSEGYCYSIVESLCNHVPVIATDIAVLKEIGCNEQNSIILNFDLSNVDCNLIYQKKGKWKFDYSPPVSNFEQTLVKGRRDVDMYEVIATKNFYDIESKEKRIKGISKFVVDQCRCDYLVANNAVKVLQKIEQREKEQENSEITSICEQEDQLIVDDKKEQKKHKTTYKKKSK